MPLFITGEIAIDRPHRDQGTGKAVPARTVTDRRYGNQSLIHAIYVAPYRDLNCSMHCGGPVAQRSCLQMYPADVVGAIKVIAAGTPQQLPHIRQIEFRQRNERASE